MAQPNDAAVFTAAAQAAVNEILRPYPKRYRAQ